MPGIPWWKVRIVSAPEELAEEQPRTTKKLKIYNSDYLQHVPVLPPEYLQAIQEAPHADISEEELTRAIYEIADQIHALRLQEYEKQQAEFAENARIRKKEYDRSVREKTNAWQRARRKGQQWTRQRMGKWFQADKTTTTKPS